MKIFRWKIWTVMLAGSLCITFQSQAQSVNQTQRSFKRNAATVIFASLGGGILGLSTLSFYGKPQEHTDNITTGVGLGLIAGLVYIFADSQSEQHKEVRGQWIPEFESQNLASVQKSFNLTPAMTLSFDF